MFFYEVENTPLPVVGDLAIVVDSQARPVCVTKLIDVRLLPFNEVTASEAWQEGEGDLSLAYWREAHLTFFNRQYPQYLQRDFQSDDLLVFEFFEVIYR